MKGKAYICIIKQRKEFVMTTLEIKKKEFLKSIDSEETLDKLQKYLSHLKKKNTQPCRYSVKEVKDGIERSFIEVKQGRITSYEEVEKRYSL
jgi:hypothetical protein